MRSVCCNAKASPIGRGNTYVCGNCLMPCKTKIAEDDLKKLETAMSSDTPTPRTNAETLSLDDIESAADLQDAEFVFADFARQLERELAEARKELAEYRAATDPHYVDELAALKAELAEARADGIALRAWHSQFGTSQLSHAIAERDALKAENAMLTETLLGMRHATCVRYPERRCSECERIEQALASRGREAK